ncbi:PIN domain-containing protein [Chloroflexota bacterium]
MNRILFVDYENVQNIDLDFIKKESLETIVFVGKSQKKIPFEIVQKAQQLGKLITWHQIEGQGSNALDFHIAFLLGHLTATDAGKENEYIVLSKDKGFDPLLRYVQKERYNCRRINSLLELQNGTIDTSSNKNLEKALEILGKIEKPKRPRNRNTLFKYIQNILGNKTPEQETTTVIDRLFIDDKLTEHNNRLKYNF